MRFITNGNYLFKVTSFANELEVIKGTDNIGQRIIIGEKTVLLKGTTFFYQATETWEKGYRHRYNIVTWLPDGINQTSVSVRDSNVFLNSYDPTTVVRGGGSSVRLDGSHEQTIEYLDNEEGVSLLQDAMVVHLSVKEVYRMLPAYFYREAIFLILSFFFQLRAKSICVWMNRKMKYREISLTFVQVMGMMIAMISALKIFLLIL